VPTLKQVPVVLLTGAVGPQERDFAMERRSRGEYNVSSVLYCR
jgi:hypothetical protein